MKKFIILLFTLILTSCATAGYATRDTYEGKNIDVRHVLEQCYPELVTYYDEGVLRVTSIYRNVNNTGNCDYNIRYKYVKYYYTNYNEILMLLQDYYPSLYDQYRLGRIAITSVYKYVDSRGVIRHNVSYRSIYQPYYIYRSVIHPRSYRWYYHQPRPHKHHQVSPSAYHGRRR